MQHGSKQIFLNLVGNAVEFTPNDRHVTLTASMEDKWSFESVVLPNQIHQFTGAQERRVGGNRT
jgi:hypothetical protein